MMITGQKPIKYNQQGQFQIAEIVDVMGSFNQLHDPDSERRHDNLKSVGVYRVAEKEKPRPSRPLSVRRRVYTNREAWLPHLGGSRSCKRRWIS